MVGVKNYVGFGVYGVVKWGVCNVMEVIWMESVNEGINICCMILCLVVIDIEFFDYIGFEMMVVNMKVFYK